MTERKFAATSVLNPKGNVLKKINVSFIVDFCLGKYGFRLDLFFNTSRILKTINVSLVVDFCLGKYSFSLDAF